MKNLFNRIKLGLYCHRGASATEYGLIITGVALALIIVFSVVTGALSDGFYFIRDTIVNAASGG